MPSATARALCRTQARPPLAGDTAQESGAAAGLSAAVLAALSPALCGRAGIDDDRDDRQEHPMPRHADPDCRSGPFPRPPRATSGATGPGVVAAAARLPARIAALAALGLLGGAPANAAPAHTHGEATLDVAVEHDGFSVSLRVPMASLIGFEHRARSSAERKAAQEALAVLRQPATWLRADTAAACTVAAADVDADLAGRLAPAPGPVVDPRRGTAVVKRVDAAAAAQQVAEPDGHADIEVDARWRCRAPAALRGADLALFDAFARLHRVTVQVAGPRGQGGQTLTRSARRLVLTR